MISPRLLPISVSKSRVFLVVLTLLAGLVTPIAWDLSSKISAIRVSAAPANTDPTQLVRSLTVRFQPGVHAYRGATLPGAELIKGVTITLGHSYRDNIQTLSFSEPLLFDQAERIGHTLKKAGIVEFADVMLPLRELSDPLIETCIDAGAGNDGCRANQDWWMNEIGAYTAWTDNDANALGATVAVLDTGSRNHPDMTTTTSQWVAGYDMIGLSNADFFGIPTDLEGGQYTSAGDGGGRDSDATDVGNGRDGNTCHKSGIPLVGGPSIYPLADAAASSWHGVKVAGIIAAQKGNGIGISGIAPNVKIQPVRVLGKCLESDDPYNLPDGIDWAAGEQVGSLPLNTTSVQVINMSLGSLYPRTGQCPTVYQNAIDRALAKGIVVVASAGNDFREDARRNVPGGCDGVINVGATTREQTLATYSNTDADLSAPGGELGADNTKKILMLANSGAIDPATDVYKYGQGTSMSAPMVAAAVAMARTKYPLSTNPAHTPAAIKSALLYAASLGTQCTGCGSGILNIPRFLGVLSPTEAPTVVRETSVTQGRGARIRVTWSAPTTAAWNPITSYSVVARDSGGTIVDTCTKTPAETLECNLANTTQNTQYTVAITATRGATSSTTPNATITSRRQASAPSGLQVTRSDTSATFSWTEPTDLGGDTLGQLAELNVYSSQTGDSVVRRCYANESTCDVTELEPGTTYWADVKRWGDQFDFTFTSARLEFTTTGTYVAPTTTTVAPVVTTTTVAPVVTTTVAPVVTTTVAPDVTTTTISSGGSSGTTNTSGTGSQTSVSNPPSTVAAPYSVKAGATTVRSKLLSLANLKLPIGSKFTLTVSASSKKICKVLGTAIKTVKKGTCSVNVIVTPKGKKPTSKSVKIAVK
jgi:serine protease